MVNRQVRNPGELAKFNATGRVSTDIPSFAVYQGQAFDALASVAGQLSGRLGKMADQAAQREETLKGLTAGQQSGAAYLRQQALQNEAAGLTPSGPAEEQAKALLRKEEGFRDTPYWDTNAWRVGYGSDTVTLADGRTVKVTQGMKITREDAERDFVHRLTNVEGKRVRDQLGDMWGKLPANAQAALYSVGYNYGSLPKNVVAAAKTGDLNALSSAVAGLSANTGRRRREAALILAKGAAPATDTADPSKVIAPVNAENQPVLSTTPLALRNDGTIRGDAFDAAAIRAYAWRMQAGLTTDLANAYEQNKDDPAAFNQAVAKVRDTYLKDENFSDPRLREVFDQAFQEKSAAYARDVSARQEGQLRQQEQASFAEALTAQSIELERQSQLIGASKDGDKLMQGQLDKVLGNIAIAERAGTISPAYAQKARLEATETAIRGRIQGVYDALPNAAGKREFALSLLEDWKDGKGPIAKLPFDTVKGISGTLFNDATAKISRETAANRLEASRYTDLIKDDIASIEATGQGLNPKDSGLDPARAEELLGPEKMLAWKADRDAAGRLYSATAGMETQSADDLTERLAMLEPKPGTPGFAEQERVFVAAQKKASAILKERTQDPAAAVEKSFDQVKQLADAASPQDPQSMSNLVSARLQAQASLGIPDLAQEPLTNEEAANLSRSVTLQPDPVKQAQRMAELADQVKAAYGPHAEKVMGQILRARGVDRELATMGAAFFKRASAKLTPADTRAADTADDVSAADRAGMPRATDQFPLPNYRQQQMLLDRPELASDFDRKFGPGAAQRILGKRKTPAQSYQTEEGTVTVNPDGSEDFTPKAK